MVPPTLAYWAVQTSNATLLDMAVEQCTLYHDVLGIEHRPAAGRNTTRDGSPCRAGGLWQHIRGEPPGDNQDAGLWSTGNAWAAAGMARVLATAQHSQLRADRALVARLTRSLRDILDGAMALDRAEPGQPLLRNYLNDTAWFAELAGTTLLAATAYRAAQLAPAMFGRGYTAWADAKREAVTATIGGDGLLAPVVNPLDWNDRTPGSASPEAQSFAILLFSAYRSHQR